MPEWGITLEVVDHLFDGFDMVFGGWHAFMVGVFLFQ